MLLPARRMLCDTAGPSQIEEFLRRASRPKMGKAKAKQSAGQRAIDLTKHLSKFEDMSYEQLLQVACGLHIENALSGGGTSWLPAPRSPARAALGQATRARYSPLHENPCARPPPQARKVDLDPLGLPCQDRKRLLRFVDKARQGWLHDGREGGKQWKGWVPPEHARSSS